MLDNCFTLHFCLQGAMVLLMGSKEEDVPNEPVQKALFVEDMNDDELASAVSFICTKY